MTGKIYVITGPSGVGKGTLCKRLLEADTNLCISISATSRPRREGEEDGVNYFFKSREEFKELIQAGDQLLEWAEYNNNYYGTPRVYVESKLYTGRSVLLEIETKGALMVKRQYADACLIFIAPPHMDELESRLRGRGTETEADIANRLEISRQEMAMQDQFDYVLVNDDLEACIAALQKIIADTRGS